APQNPAILQIRLLGPGAQTRRTPGQGALFTGNYFFAGVEGRGVAREIFLDGNTFRDSPSVSRRWFNAEVQGGVALTYGPMRLTYTQVYRSPQIRNRDVWDSFGSVALSVRVPF
ncbi:MAG: lipid A-modifier LpxR family protein, partial [Pseudomonadota bacterium]